MDWPCRRRLQDSKRLQIRDVEKWLKAGRLESKWWWTNKEPGIIKKICVIFKNVFFVCYFYSLCVIHIIHFMMSYAIKKKGKARTKFRIIFTGKTKKLTGLTRHHRFCRSVPFVAHYFSNFTRVIQLLLHNIILSSFGGDERIIHPRLFNFFLLLLLFLLVLLHAPTPTLRRAGQWQ